MEESDALRTFLNIKKGPVHSRSVNENPSDKYSMGRQKRILGEVDMDG